ncbi:hypothetical protein NPIL_42561, partial [Nephila pilipes]
PHHDEKTHTIWMAYFAPEARRNELFLFTCRDGRHICKIWIEWTEVGLEIGRSEIKNSIP